MTLFKRVYHFFAWNVFALCFLIFFPKTTFFSLAYLFHHSSRQLAFNALYAVLVLTFNLSYATYLLIVCLRNYINYKLTNNKIQQAIQENIKLQQMKRIRYLELSESKLRRQSCDNLNFNLNNEMQPSFGNLTPHKGNPFQRRSSLSIQDNQKVTPTQIRLSNNNCIMTPLSQRLSCLSSPRMSGQNYPSPQQRHSIIMYDNFHLASRKPSPRLSIQNMTENDNVKDNSSYNCQAQFQQLQCSPARSLQHVVGVGMGMPNNNSAVGGVPRIQRSSSLLAFKQQQNQQQLQSNLSQNRIQLDQQANTNNDKNANSIKQQNNINVTMPQLSAEKGILEERFLQLRVVMNDHRQSVSSVFLPTLVLLRVTLFAVIIASLAGSSPFLAVTLLIMLQCMAMLYLLLIRPFKSKAQMILNFLIELSFLFILTFTFVLSYWHIQNMNQQPSGYSARQTLMNGLVCSHGIFVGLCLLDSVARPILEATIFIIIRLFSLTKQLQVENNININLNNIHNSNTVSQLHSSVRSLPVTATATATTITNTNNQLARNLNSARNSSQFRITHNKDIMMVESQSTGSLGNNIKMEALPLSNTNMSVNVNGHQNQNSIINTTNNQNQNTRNLSIIQQESGIQSITDDDDSQIIDVYTTDHDNRNLPQQQQKIKMAVMPQQKQNNHLLQNENQSSLKNKHRNRSQNRNEGREPHLEQQYTQMNQRQSTGLYQNDLSEIEKQAIYTGNYLSNEGHNFENGHISSHTTNTNSQTTNQNFITQPKTNYHDTRLYNNINNTNNNEAYLNHNQIEESSQTQNSIQNNENVENEQQQEDVPPEQTENQHINNAQSIALMQKKQHLTKHLDVNRNLFQSHQVLPQSSKLQSTSLQSLSLQSQKINPSQSLPQQQLQLQFKKKNQNRQEISVKNESSMSLSSVQSGQQQQHESSKQRKVRTKNRFKVEREMEGNDENQQPEQQQLQYQLHNNRKAALMRNILGDGWKISNIKQQEQEVAAELDLESCSPKTKNHVECAKLSALNQLKFAM